MVKDVVTGDVLAQFEPPHIKDLKILEMIFNSRQKRIKLIFSSGMIRDYDLENFKQISEVHFINDVISMVSLSNDSSKMIYISSGCIVKLYDLEKNVEIAPKIDLILGILSSSSLKSRKHFNYRDC